MSVEKDTAIADESLSLRREVVGLRQALRAEHDANDALRYENERLRKTMQLVVAEVHVFTLAVERALREFK